MDNTLLREYLIFEESIDCNAHLVKGVRHIAIGHNLEIEQTPEELAAMGLTAVPASWEGFSITEQQAYDLFDIDVQDALDDVQPTFMPDELEALGETRRAIILAMVFQSGGAGLRKYKKFIAAVKARDFEEAAKEMLDSKWAREDSPARAQRAADAMRTGEITFLPDRPVSQPPTTTPVVDSNNDDSIWHEVADLLNSRGYGGKKK